MVPGSSPGGPTKIAAQRAAIFNYSLRILTYLFGHFLHSVITHSHSPPGLTNLVTTTDACPIHNGTLSDLYQILCSMTAPVKVAYAATGNFILLLRG